MSALANDLLWRVGLRLILSIDTQIHNVQSGREKNTYAKAEERCEGFGAF